MERQQLHRTSSPTRHHAPQWMSAWDTLYEALRAPLAGICMRMDSTLTDLRVGGDEVTAEFSDGYTTTVDLLVGADGIGSATRRIITGHDEATYSGYVAFRGLEPESNLPEHLSDLLAERFTSFAVPGMQMLCYLVPGERGAGERRVNWVWYVNTAETRLPELLTGKSGHRFDFFLPPGELAPASRDALMNLVDRTLPEPFAALVRLSAVFMQPVFDLPAIGMVGDRVVLLGDAAGTVRPHTASGTSKALGDAEQLADALEGWRRDDPLPRGRLEAWGSDRLGHLRAVADVGVRLAARSWLGVDAPGFL
jgi:2-polyprenyl-6-methoxyphenol hydroxylase-like FAD-dependent oxidoreductase